MDSLPEHVIESIVTRRKGRVKISCIFCERRIGWFSPSEIKNILHMNGGVVSCQSCKQSLPKQYQSTKESSLIEYS